MSSKLELKSSLAIARLHINKHKIGSIILNKAKKEKQIIYGSVATNIQLNPSLRRKAGDYDVYSNHPKKSADQTQRQLDRVVGDGNDDFYYKEAVHKGTWKVMHEGKDGEPKTRDDIAIVDYSKPSKKIDTVTINDIRYENINSILKRRREILADPKSKYRHAKDRLTKDIILTSKKMRSDTI